MSSPEAQHAEMPAGRPLAVLERVDLRRAGRMLFRDLSLTFTERRIGLVGHNGSGKSSLLRLIHGLLKPDSGVVHTLGFDTKTDAAKIPAHSGFLFQNPDHQILFPTVGEEIGFGLTSRGCPRVEMEARVEAVLAAHGCRGWARRAVDELSGGQKQLVCLMAVMVLEPRLLLLDEPFSSLDFATRLAFIRRMRTLAPSAILASHDLDLLADCDRVIWLEAGKVLADGPPADILPAYREDAMRRAEMSA